MRSIELEFFGNCEHLQLFYYRRIDHVYHLRTKIQSLPIHLNAEGKSSDVA